VRGGGVAGDSAGAATAAFDAPTPAGYADPG